jgi:hypothetical protein
MLMRTFRLQLRAVRGALIGALIYAAALSGCSVLQSPEQSTTVVPAATQTSLSPMQYAAWLRGLSTEQRQVERARLEDARQKDSLQKDPVTNLIEGVQLALLLSSFTPADNDEFLLAIAVLTEVIGMEAPASEMEQEAMITDYAEFAQLWHAALLQQASVLTISEERAALIERLQERNLMLSNENLRLQERSEALATENPLLQEEILNLQLQIDGLKKIEEQLNQRELLQDSP